MELTKTINTMSNPNSFTFCSTKCHIKQVVCITCRIQNESKVNSIVAKNNRESRRKSRCIILSEIKRKLSIIENDNIDIIVKNIVRRRSWDSPHTINRSISTPILPIYPSIRIHRRSSISAPPIMESI
jgi:hypothetical protein